MKQLQPLSSLAKEKIDREHCCLRHGKTAARSLTLKGKSMTRVGWPNIVFSIAAEPKSKLRDAIKAPLSALRGRLGKGCEETCLPPPLLQEVQNIMECKLTQLQVRGLDKYHHCICMTHSTSPLFLWGIEDQSSLKNVVAKVLSTIPLQSIYGLRLNHYGFGVKLNGLRVKLGEGFTW
eukprot:6492805-Amphidinium_carterae.2